MSKSWCTSYHDRFWFLVKGEVRLSEEREKMREGTG
jgi:hypothetical protein